MLPGQPQGNPASSPSPNPVCNSLGSVFVAGAGDPGPYTINVAGAEPDSLRLRGDSIAPGVGMTHGPALPLPGGPGVPGVNDPAFNHFMEVVNSTLLSRQELTRALTDRRRDIDDECGYPKGVQSAQFYQDLFDFHGVANRVTNVYPKEAWQVQPFVYEDEDSEKVTPFEEAWDALGQSLRGEMSWYRDEKGSPIWEYLERADVMSGIGRFGVILLGLDDGQELNTPVEGVRLNDETVTSPEAPPPLSPSEGPGAAPVRGSVPAGRNGTRIGGYSGTDLQYGNMTLTSPVDERGQPVQGQPRTYRVSKSPGASKRKAPAKPRRLLFMRVFAESLVQVTQYDADRDSPRYGQPIRYLITLNDPRSQSTGIGLPIQTVDVHWTRVIHIADNLCSSECFGTPRMQPVLHYLLNLNKLYGGSAEMYWRGAFPGYVLSTHPQLGGDVKVNTPLMRDQMENYMNGLQRYVMLMGMGMTGLAPQVVDPTAQINVQLDAICITLAMPKRIFVGSERGELASSQDDAAWNDRIRKREDYYITPRVIIPLVDRLIAVGVLPEPDSFCVGWPDLTSQTQGEKATVALTKVQALSAFLAGNCEAAMPLLDFYVDFLGMTEERAKSIIDAATKEQEEKAKEAQLHPPPGVPGAPGAPPVPGQPAAPGAPPGKAPGPFPPAPGKPPFPGAARAKPAIPGTQAPPA